MDVKINGGNTAAFFGIKIHTKVYYSNFVCLYKY